MNLIKQHRVLSAFAGSLLLITALVWIGQLIWPAALEAHDLPAVESPATSTSQAPATPQPISPQPLQTTASSRLPPPSPTPSPKPEPTEPPLETDEQGVVQEHLSVASFKPDQSTLYVRAFKANVRQEPRTDVPVLDQLEMGDLLTRTGYGEFWSQVKTADNQTGYVLTELLSEDIIYKPKAPEPTRPPQPTPQPSQASAPQATQPLATPTSAEETKPPVSEESQAPVESQPAPEQPGESEEFLLFARVVALEGQKYVYDSYLSVATVIMNHVAHPAYPNTVTGVLKRKGAFYTYSQAAAGSPATLPDAAYQAAYDAYYLDKRNMPAYVIAFATPQAYANNAYFQSLSVYDRKYNTVWCYNERDKK